MMICDAAPRPGGGDLASASSTASAAFKDCALEDGGGEASADCEVSVSLDALLWKVSWLVAYPWMLVLLFDEREDDDDAYYCWLHVAWSKGYGIGGNDCDIFCRSSRKLVTNNSSLGYGEIVPSSLWTVVRHWLADPNEDHNEATTCVVDLGSGSGRALLATSLAVLWLQNHCRPLQANIDFEPNLHAGNLEVGGGRPILKLVGMEIDPDWQPIARRNFQRVYYGDGSTRYSSLCGHSSSSLVEASFRTSDFTVKNDWTHFADLVLCHATVFSDKLMAATANVCALCRPGTCFLLVSKPLLHAEIKTLRTGQLEMSWGQATVYLQRRR